MSFKHLVEETMKRGSADAVIAEKSPPGFKGTVKAMKKHGDEVDNPYALAWWMKNKGYKSHRKASGAKKESIRVEHPVHGNGTVEAITESNIKITWDNLDKRMSAPDTIAFEDAKYLTRLAEKKPVKESKKPMKKKQKIDEAVVAVGMAPVQGTHRGEEELMAEEDDILRFDDLLSEDDEWNKPWEEDDSDSDDGRDEDMDGDVHGLRDAEDTREYDGADYTNVPRPSDSVLTNQEDQPEYSADPLATKDGFNAATDGDEPDGDYADIQPVDAPDTPQVRDLEGSAERGNTRDAGDDSDDTQEVDAGSYDESKPEDNGGEEEMSKKNESAWLNAEDLGLELTEMSDPMGGMDFDEAGGCGYDEGYGDMKEHEMTGNEVAMTCDFMEKLLKACSSQSPDDAKVKALCDGLKAAQQEKGDMSLDEGDWPKVKAAAAEAFGGGDMGEAYSDDAEYEDKAEGDGEEAGPEGGPEHEGKTKMMDGKGGEHDLDDDGDEDSDDWKMARDRKIKQSMKRNKPKKSQQHEAKGGSSGTPVGTGSTSGSGGGGQTDLSKPKAYHGKPVGTGTSGAGGSSADEYGQKPHADGGTNLVPEYEDGNELGADNTVFPDKGQKPAPRNTKPLAAESKKKAQSKAKLDEAIMLGMSGIPGTIRNDHSDVPEDTDWDEELAVIKRRAGMDKWWENNA